MLFQSESIRFGILMGCILALCTSGCGDDDATGPQTGGSKTTVITVVADGYARDGLFDEKDGIPDYIFTGGGIQVLNVDRVNSPFEDRGIFEFDLSTMPDTFVTAALELSVSNSLGPYPFTLVLADYVGNGVAELNDFTSGADIRTIAYNGESSIAIDVTSSIQIHSDAEDSYAGFVLRFDPATIIAYNFPYVYFGSLASPPAAVLKIVEP